MKLHRKILRGAGILMLFLSLVTTTGCAGPRSIPVVGSFLDGYQAAENNYQAATDADSGEAAASPVSNGTNAEYSDEDRYPYYAQLTDSQRTVYQAIVSAASAGLTEFPLNVEADTDDVNAAANAVFCEQPQLFWLDAWGTSYDALTGQVQEVSLTFNALGDDLEHNISTFEAAGQAVLSTLDGLSDIEKEKAIHDYVAGNTAYASGELDQTAYSALVNHTGVCAAYTKAFQYLMQCAGIPTYQCSGTANGGDGWDDHAWNIVKLGDGYYNVDVTWDETGGADLGLICYSYYNQTDDYFMTEHRRDEASEFLPACTATEYSYESVYGVPAEMGIASQLDLTCDQPVTTQEDFNQLMQDAVITNGTGTWSYSYMVEGDACEDAISQEVSDGSMQSAFLDAAADALGLNGYSSSISYSDLDFGNGWHYITLEISLS